MFFVSVPSWGTSSFLKKKIVRLNWDGTEVIWLKDDRIPLYYISFYFADGALSDKKGLEGETSMMFSQLDHGTKRYNYKEISDALEYYGVSFSPYLTHEYSTYNISGLIKDLVPTMKMICHLFQNATFPKRELKKYVQIKRNRLNNLVTSHSTLANRVFRKVSLRDSKVMNPVSGNIRSIRKIKSHHLQKKLDYFKNNVKKRIYMAGSAQLKDIRSIIENDCQWNSKASFVRNFKIDRRKQRPDQGVIYLVPVPNANQAQIRIGRYLTPGSIQDKDLMLVSSSYLGGAYTSKLMQELRVKRGLTYSVGAYAVSQRNYGRAVISTFTKNSSINETLSTIKSVLGQSEGHHLRHQELKKIVNYLSGNYLFTFEHSEDYLTNLIYFDHIGRDFRELFDFTQNIQKYSKSDVSSALSDLYSWDKQTVVVIGHKSLKKKLKEFGKVKILRYQDFL